MGTIKGSGTNGDDLLCMGINTEPATEEVVAEPVAQEFVQGGTLKLNWNDCGAKHGKVTGLSPTTLALGQETAVTGSGSVDEAVSGGKVSVGTKIKMAGALPASLARAAITIKGSGTNG